MAILPTNSRQIPDQSIMDYFNRQSYTGNQFIYALRSTIAGTTETNLLYLLNPSANSGASGGGNQNIGLFLNLRRVTSVTASQSILLNFYLNPTVGTNGTAQTPVSARPAFALSSKMSLFSAPTSSANGTLIGSIMASAQSSQQNNFMMVLDPGQSMLVTVIAGAANNVAVTELGWYEM